MLSDDNFHAFNINLLENQKGESKGQEEWRYIETSMQKIQMKLWASEWYKYIFQYSLFSDLPIEFQKTKI